VDRGSGREICGQPAIESGGERNEFDRNRGSSECTIACAGRHRRTLVLRGTTKPAATHHTTVLPTPSPRPAARDAAASGSHLSQSIQWLRRLSLSQRTTFVSVQRMAPFGLGPAFIGLPTADRAGTRLCCPVIRETVRPPRSEAFYTAIATKRAIQRRHSTGWEISSLASRAITYRRAANGCLVMSRSLSPLTTNRAAIICGRILSGREHLPH
jgi:hypothetical protein